MTTQHTPGPWTFSRSDNFGDVRFYIAQQDDAPYTPDYSDVATLISETVSSERTSIQEANAYLIAAAPELLKDLREASATLRKYEVLHRGKGTAESDAKAEVNGALAIRFEATIAKATGAA